MRSTVPRSVRRLSAKRSSYSRISLRIRSSSPCCRRIALVWGTVPAACSLDVLLPCFPDFGEVDAFLFFPVFRRASLRWTFEELRAFFEEEDAPCREGFDTLLLSFFFAPGFAL
ncbi:MAG: hypothetical protein HY962_04070 [Ignavibacteriae bacterium]|nr:hypothetical protein [Ignavibacteriota bacterium]